MLFPYEILQLISSFLLPKYQCRLALTSHHNYRYLYTDILKWHAKWRQVSPPKCRIINNTVTIWEYNQKLVYACKRFGDKLSFINTTERMLYRHITDSSGEKFNMIFDDEIYNTFIMASIATVKIESFNGFYKYMHRRVLHLFAGIKMSRLLSLPYSLIDKIRCYVRDNRARYDLTSKGYIALLNSHQYIFYHMAICL